MHIELGTPFWIAAAISVAAALAYGFLFLNKPPSFPRAIVKTLFMGALAAGLASAGVPTPLLLALGFAALGDFFLAFDKTWTLGLGILSFLLMQLLYIVIFFALWLMSADNSPLWPRYGAMVVIAIVAIGFLVWLAPKLKWLALGVVPYALFIAGAAMMAMWMPWAGWGAILGMALFLISDGVLSAELFALPADAPQRRWTAPLVWWTYVGAQLFILYGVICAARVMA